MKVDGPGAGLGTVVNPGSGAVEFNPLHKDRFACAMYVHSIRGQRPRVSLPAGGVKAGVEGQIVAVRVRVAGGIEQQ